jgi:hypothetical protein
MVYPLFLLVAVAWVYGTPPFLLTCSGSVGQLGYGAFFKTALSGDTLEIAGFSSVDDTDLS